MAGISRRGFLQTGTGAALASVARGRRYALAAQIASTPGEPVRFASIGVGIEGSILLRALMTLPQAKCVAACDLYDGRHTLAREIAGDSIKTTRNYREILEDKSIECVIVATHDQSHKQVTLDALAAGKDVYCEKPMSHSLADGEAMVKAVRSGKNFIQVGSQRVSSAVFTQARTLMSQGAIGDLLQVELQLGRNSPGGAWEYPVLPDLSPTTLDWDAWQGTVPKKNFDPVAFTRWRCFREYGTGMAGDLMVHLLSGMQCITGINALPDQAYSVGGIERWKDGRNMPDVMSTVFRYGAVPVSVRLTLGTGTPEMTRILGSKGTIEVTDNTVILTPQTGRDSSPDYGINGFPRALHAEYEKQWHAEHDAELAAHPFAESTIWHGSSWDEHRPHLANFIRAVRTREPVQEDAVFGHHAAGSCHMANLSYFQAKVVTKSQAAG